MKTLKLALLTLALAGPVAGSAAAQSNPSEDQTRSARSRGPCSDPWVTMALESLFRRVPSSACDIKLYNNGSWGSYAQLLGAVRSTYRPVVIGGNGPLAGKAALGVFSGSQLIGAGGASMVAAGGGNMVAAGGGNMVAAGGGNIMLQQGNRLVSPGGGNYSLQSTSKPVRVIG
jgi:hypothetical protein